MKEAGQQITCPVCKKGMRWDDNPFRPFCSERCKLLDLGNWAAESYRIGSERKNPQDREVDEIKRTEK